MANPFIDRIKEAVERGDPDSLHVFVDEVASYCFEKECSNVEPFSDEVFEAVLISLENEQFQQMKNSHNLIMLFQFDWGRLTAKQRDELLIVLERVYPKLKESMACHVISEIFGRFAKSEASFAALSRLNARTTGNARALIPLGFETLARETSNPALRTRCLRVLETLRKDDNEEIRNEANISLRRLRKLTAQE